MANFKTSATFFVVDGGGVVKIRVKLGKHEVYEETLTVGQDFGILLIRALDKLFSGNRIDRLSLKNVVIRGEMASNRLSCMILRSVASALSV